MNGGNGGGVKVSKERDTSPAVGGVIVLLILLFFVFFLHMCSVNSEHHRMQERLDRIIEKGFTT